MSSDSPNSSRRAMVGGLATGLLGAAVAPASAAAQKVDASPAVPLVDPTTAYKKPPFEVQQQPWPGLASKMNPRPDHGASRGIGGI